MRHAWIVLVALAGTARADDDFAPWPKHSLGLGIQGHATGVGGATEGGFGPAIEVGYGRGRWQYFGEGSLATTDLEDTAMPVAGRMLRGGVGIRWLARQFTPDPAGALELYLDASAGLEAFYWNDGGRLTRPDLGVGFGLQARLFKHGAFRLDARVVFTPTDRDRALVACRGPCPTSTASTGLLVGFGFAW